MSTIRQLGTYKSKIYESLFNYKPIKNLLIGGTNGKSASKIRSQFKDHVRRHLFIDETVDTVDSYIFYDVYIPSLHPHVKSMAIKIVCISHKDMLDSYESEVDSNGDPIYPGNRVDAMAQMVEDCLVNDEEVARSFGIGRLDLTAVSYYLGQHHYGLVLDFEGIADFR